MRIAQASDSSILVSFADTISDEANSRVHALFAALQRDTHPAIVNLHPAYSSLLIDFDPLVIEAAEIVAHVERLTPESSVRTSTRELEISVCYDAEFAPDLDSVAQHAKLTREEVIAIHQQATYTVAFLGFAPGFGYLSGLDQRLSVPRHSSPRKHVAAGSVGVAGAQTAVYPFDSPGGWQLIGRTPLRMFDAARSQASLLQPGDTVRFRAISRAEFDRIAAERA